MEPMSDEEQLDYYVQYIGNWTVEEIRKDPQTYQNLISEFMQYLAETDRLS
jgi:hypothetical protein